MSLSLYFYFLEKTAIQEYNKTYGLFWGEKP